MEIYTYRAASLQEALMLVRHELGPDASVLQTREVSGRFFGLLGKRTIEVTASRDAKVVRRLPQHASASTVDAGGTTIESESTPSANQMQMHNTFDLTEDDEATSGHVLLATEEHESDDGVELGGGLPNGSQQNTAHAGWQSATHAHAGQRPTLQAHAGQRPTPQDRPNYLSPAMFEVFTELLDADIDPDAARIMLQEVAMHCTPHQMDDPWLIKGRLCQLVQQQINVAGPMEMNNGQRHIIALVGPTGVGKTTTLAKLAAGYHFDQGLEVGFITLDTFRLGAVDQLQKYAELLGAPCEVVSSPDQIPAALDRLAHCHLIFIDTAGRSPRDEAQLGVLAEFLRVAQPTQTHLVLSAASSQAHAEMALEQFRAVEPTHLLLTKLDEASLLGSWYRLLSGGVWPLSYITTGQNVPEDILVANRRRVASLILGQSNHIGSPKHSGGSRVR